MKPHAFCSARFCVHPRNRVGFILGSVALPQAGREADQKVGADFLPAMGTEDKHGWGVGRQAWHGQQGRWGPGSRKTSRSQAVPRRIGIRPSQSRVTISTAWDPAEPGWSGWDLLAPLSRRTRRKGTLHAAPFPALRRSAGLRSVARETYESIHLLAAQRPFRRRLLAAEQERRPGGHVHASNNRDTGGGRAGARKLLTEMVRGAAGGPEAVGTGQHLPSGISSSRAGWCNSRTERELGAEETPFLKITPLRE